MEAKAFVLMPYYRTRSDLFKKSLTSFLKQDYQNKKLVIYVDNEIRCEKELIRILEGLKKEQKKQITLINGKRHIGVAKARNGLLWYVRKHISDDDYIFLLDSDDEYTDNKAISRVINSMTKHKADVAVLNFKYGFFDGKTEDAGLKKTREETSAIARKYSKPHSFEPSKDLSTLTSLGWTRVYKSKTFKKLPVVQKTGKYEDFVYMAPFCFDNIKVVGVTIPSIKFNKYSSSTTSMRTEKDCEDVVDRLNELKRSYRKMCAEMGEKLPIHKKIIFSKCLENFINTKLEQYRIIFKNYDNSHKTQLSEKFLEAINNKMTVKEKKQCQM